MKSLGSPDPAALASALTASRARSTAITRDFDGERLLGPRLAIVNPPLWELGHVAWFQEYWCLRYREGTPPSASIAPGADQLYDSAKVAHDTRWDLPLLAIDKVRAYQSAVLERVFSRLTREPENATLQYFVQLATFHEDMHAEAFHYTRQTLGYSDPFAEQVASFEKVTTFARPSPPAPLPGGEGSFERQMGGSAGASTTDIELPGGRFMLGATPEDGFVFDNEKWAHEVRIAPFRIARYAVTHAEYLAFVEAGGYLRREWWSEEGWVWRAAAQLQAPCYWVRQEGAWCSRRFDQTVALPLDHPVVHINWHEAQAYCVYAQRRLPTEAEWEYAASMPGKRRYSWGDAAPTPERANLEGFGTAAVGAYADGDTSGGCRQMIGNVWEWTASTFEPYPGFVIDPYEEYSQPWFGDHKVLRGGSFATVARLIRNTWRNFYTPDRNDVFAGFRTCAID